MEISHIPKLVFNKQNTIKRVIILSIALYFFLVSIEVMGAAFKLFGRDFAEQLLTTTSNPFVGVVVGILATSLVQSSSCTTSIVVGLVAAGGLSLPNAIPIIMGANIGTSVTNTLVALGHITKRDEFRRAFSGATVHDLFNLLAVSTLLPLELTTHILQNTATFLSTAFTSVGGLAFISPLKCITKPSVELLRGVVAHPLPLLILGLVLLFSCLTIMVKMMRSLVINKFEVLFDRYLFRSAFTAFFLGFLFTSVVQSSSVTTSLAVPLLAAGLVTVSRIFPYTLGANLGTTLTALLAAFVTHSPVAIAVALTHLLFNLFGILIWYPLRRVPITLAEKLGELASRSRRIAFFYIVGVFYVIPVLLVFVWR